ncbi:MAG: polyprenyl synthetase family protein [Haloarculaceae archaeon]
MTRDSALLGRRDEIDRYVERVLSDATGEYLHPVRASVRDRGDRRYGELLALVHDSAAGPSADDSVVPAAAAVELLREYCWLRARLLAEVDDGPVALPWDRTTALLSADYLYAAAYAALGRVDDAAVEPCFETATDVSTSVIEGLDAVDWADQSSPSSGEYCSLIDETAGALGRGAARIGATLAGVDGAAREQYATLGRGLGSVHAVRLVLDAREERSQPLFPASDDRRLRRYARRRLAEAERAVRSLPATADADRVRSFVDRVASAALTEPAPE